MCYASSSVLVAAGLEGHYPLIVPAKVSLLLPNGTFYRRSLGCDYYYAALTGKFSQKVRCCCRWFYSRRSLKVCFPTNTLIQIFLDDNGFKPIKEVKYNHLRDKYGEKVVIAGEHTSTVTAYKKL